MPTPESSTYGQSNPRQAYGKMAPKVMILNMFNDEAQIWHTSLPTLGHGSLLENNISIGGLFPLDPHVHCTASGVVCQATLGESEINAAASTSALVLGADAAARFDLSRTYFLISGIAGVNPKLGTLGSVALARFAVQAALQYELDARDMPANFSTGYLAYGTSAPGRAPTSWYGTEVMEVNEALRDAAFDLARNVSSSGDGSSHAPVLDDDDAAAEYRAKYDTTTSDGSSNSNSGVNKHENVYEAATGPPSVLRCDSVTSDNYYSGPLLSEAFENTTRVWTNQSEVTYCMTAQEDSAVLQVLLRAHLARRADFSRAIVMRAGSNFDRPPPNMTALEHLQLLGQNGFALALNNTWNAGGRIVAGILSDWDRVYGPGIPPTNYIGDVFGSLGGVPDFGPGRGVFGGSSAAAADGSTYAGGGKGG
ncbi:purine nucleoside permease-domain-containing protein [Apiospora marii]|uniref:Purine nucleoside permease-domain-containing protein n=1 Tax=Apiospora marii TaxID=335849 RepID=A0ABR1R074_9PEZI